MNHSEVSSRNKKGTYLYMEYQNGLWLNSRLIMMIHSEVTEATWNIRNVAVLFASEFPSE